MSALVAGKVALVVGAGTAGGALGNGRAAALAYGREGAKVLACDIERASAEETAKMIREAGGAAQACTVDVADEASVAAMVATCRDSFGSVDILHNNVGIAAPTGLLETTPEQWERVLRINATGVYLCCRAVVPHMLAAGGGAIVNVSSLSSTRAIRPELAYAASKGALNSLTVNLALEFADRGIRCNAILPGLIETPMVEQFLAAQMPAEEVRAALAVRHKVSPTGKMGTPHDIAELAVFLASDKARYLNGMLITVDGGLQFKIPSA